VVGRRSAPIPDVFEADRIAVDDIDVGQRESHVFLTAITYGTI
jgi:hypothetical protein